MSQSIIDANANMNVMFWQLFYTLLQQCVAIIVGKGIFSNGKVDELLKISNFYMVNKVAYLISPVSVVSLSIPENPVPNFENNESVLHNKTSVIWSIQV